MKTINIKYKDGFKIEENTRFYPVNSDINDKVGILVEHRILNGNNRYLRYAIQKISGKYYFFDVRNSVIAKTKEQEYNTYICPYCKERMFIVSSFERSGTVVPIHLKHYKKTNKECIFRTDSKSIKLKEDYYKSEEFMHREIQELVCKNARQGFRLSIPSSYKLYKNTMTHDIRAEIQKERVNIVKAVSIYDTSNKYHKKYTPDIILYTDDNKEIYCEIAVYKSINTAQYYEEWKALGKTVIEIKKTEMMDIHLDEYKFSRDLIITYLYDAVLDEARIRKISESKKIIDNFNNENHMKSEREDFDKTKSKKLKNDKNKLKQDIEEKEYREFANKVDAEIKKHLKTLLDENILRVEYRYVKTKKKKNKPKETKRETVYFDVKANKQARNINAVIKKYNKIAHRRIPAMVGNYLRCDGYKVSISSKKCK